MHAMADAMGSPVTRRNNSCSDPLSASRMTPHKGFHSLLGRLLPLHPGDPLSVRAEPRDGTARWKKLGPRLSRWVQVLEYRINPQFIGICDSRDFILSFVQDALSDFFYSSFVISLHSLRPGLPEDGACNNNDRGVGDRRDTVARPRASRAVRHQ